MSGISAVSQSPVALTAAAPRSVVGGTAELSDEQQAKIQELKQRDAEVRRHEQAHVHAGGSLAGAPSYEYTRGPDGRQYAVNGEVGIDTRPAQSPEATIRKMEVVIRAALAPADPSAQDRKVAAQARQAKVDAEAELRTEERDSAEQGADPTASPAVTDQALALYRQVAAITEDPFGPNARPSASIIA